MTDLVFLSDDDDDDDDSFQSALETPLEDSFILPCSSSSSSSSSSSIGPIITTNTTPSIRNNKDIDSQWEDTKNDVDITKINNHISIPKKKEQKQQQQQQQLEEDHNLIQTYSFVTRRQNDDDDDDDDDNVQQQQQLWKNQDGIGSSSSSSSTVIVGSMYWSETTTTTTKKKDDNDPPSSSNNNNNNNNILVMGTNHGYLIMDTRNHPNKNVFRDITNKSCSLAWLLKGTSLLSLVYQDDPRTLLYVHVTSNTRHRRRQQQQRSSSSSSSSHPNVITTASYAHAILRVQVMHTSSSSSSSTKTITNHCNEDSMTTNNNNNNKKKKKQQKQTTKEFRIFVLLQNGDLLVHNHTDTSTPKFIISTLFPTILNSSSSSGIKNNNIEYNQRSLLKPQMAWTVGWLWDFSSNDSTTTTTTTTSTLVTKYGRTKMKIHPLYYENDDDNNNDNNDNNTTITIETRHQTSLTRIRIHSSIILTCDMQGMTCHLYQLPHGIPYRQFQLYRGSTPCTLYSITLFQNNNNNNTNMNNNNEEEEEEYSDGDKIGLWSDHGTIHVFSDWKSKSKQKQHTHSRFFWNPSSSSKDVTTVMIPATWKISMKEQKKTFGTLTFASESKIVMATKDGTILGYDLLDTSTTTTTTKSNHTLTTKPYLAENILLR